MQTTPAYVVFYQAEFLYSRKVPLPLFLVILWIGRGRRYDDSEESERHATPYTCMGNKDEGEDRACILSLFDQRRHSRWKVVLEILVWNSSLVLNLGLPLTPLIAQLLITLLPDLNALYENSDPFMRYLKKQGLGGILRDTKLELRERHTIVPRNAFNAPHVKRRYNSAVPGTPVWISVCTVRISR